MVTAPDIPGHRVGGVLGAGGFAAVDRCWRVAVGREVAMKVMTWYCPPGTMSKPGRAVTV